MEISIKIPRVGGHASLKKPGCSKLTFRLYYFILILLGFETKKDFYHKTFEFEVKLFYLCYNLRA